MCWEITPRDLSRISKWQQLAPDAHSSNLSISERGLALVEKGDEGSGPVHSQVLGCGGGGLSLAELVYRHQKFSCWYLALQTHQPRDSRNIWAWTVSPMGSVATGSPSIYVPRSSRQDSSQFHVALFSVTGWRGGRDRGDTATSHLSVKPIVPCSAGETWQRSTSGFSFSYILPFCLHLPCSVCSSLSCTSVLM